jgi:predicted ATPase
VVLICAEPGIGKSRLAAVLRERLEGEDLTRLRYFSSPHHQDSALYPFIAQLEYAAGFGREDPVETKLDKLEALLAPTSPPLEDVGLLAELLSLPAASRYSLPPSTPQRRREKTFEALLRQLEALARRRPVLMVFEDLHWIDPSSHELLDRTIERVSHLPVLLLATFRPEFAPPWSGLPQATMLTLARLDRLTGAAMVESIAGNAAMSSVVAAEIVERADGVPLFVEELTRAVLEAGGRGAEVEETLARAVSPSAAVPAALHAPLMARLDRLGQAPKEIAQIAATIGREFSYELLAPMAERREGELQDALSRLREAGLIFSRGSPPTPPISSSTRSSGTPLMEACCAAVAKSFTPASRPCSKPILRIGSRQSPSFSPGTLPKPDFSKRRFRVGCAPARGRPSVRQTSKPWRI